MTVRSARRAGLAGSLALVGAIAFFANRGSTSAGPPPCQVVASGFHYLLDRSQVSNAIIITDAAEALGLPHHAVTVALAAALQESLLHNLDHGDRDSLGLFQQRPSQGWGSPSQILDPRYAADAFVRALTRIDQWQTMSVNDAAQLVQHSATPNAYAKSEAEARAIARATTGELPGTLTCSKTK